MYIAFGFCEDWEFRAMKIQALSALLSTECPFLSSDYRVGTKIFAFVFCAKLFVKFTFRFREIFVTKRQTFAKVFAKTLRGKLKVGAFYLKVFAKTSAKVSYFLYKCVVKPKS
jgi:hypothetical protein